MDSIDVKILSLLQQNARMTVSELSKIIALSRPSTTERIQRLQEQGIIEGYYAFVPPAAIGRTILLIIQVGNLNVSPKEFEQYITEELTIIECHRVTGDSSYFMKAAVSSMSDMRDLIDRLIPFGNINTSTVLTSPIYNRAILPIPTK